MNELQISNNETKTITTLEIAEMMEMKHYQILEKLEGTKTAKGIIPILNDHNFMVVDYFSKSTYKDSKGELRPCYDVTKLGCDFLANKFTGEKGIVFTAKYVKRFRDMETVILSDEQLKANLLLSIYNGGQEGILASKQLTDIEVNKVTAPLLETIEEQKPMVEFVNHVTNSSDTVDIGELAKIIKNENIDIGRNRLFEYLRKNKILMSNNIPYQSYLTKQWFEVIETTKQTAYGSKVFSKVLVTGKGQIGIVEMLRKTIIKNN
jgi:phage regulator Rha-like protein/phage antirepressor YoqD-like protein